MNASVRHFLDAKVRALEARARRLGRLDARAVGIRPQDVPYSASPAHFRAANRRLAAVDREVVALLGGLREALDGPEARPDEVLARAALVERQIDRARRSYGLFFEVFSQRGTRFAPALAACDAIASDCFSAARQHLPDLLGSPLLKPVTYLEHGFSPATFRRGVVLRRLLGERNPFPLVRIPYERIESPWGMGILLHEVGHNLQADLGIWEETRRAVLRRVLRVSRDPWVARIWARWHKEIFADIAALLLGGPASARAMKDFLAYPAPRVMAFNPLSAHPTPYVRAFLFAEMLRRMGYPGQAGRTIRIWRSLYDPHVHRSRVPPRVLATAGRLVPEVIDEIAYQPRRGLAHHTLVDVIPFSAAEEQRIRAAARSLAADGLPDDLPPRYAPSVARYAFDLRLADPGTIARTILGSLARRVATDAPRAIAA